MASSVENQDWFKNNGYTEVADRIYFYVGSIPLLNTDQTEYSLGNDVIVSFTNGPNLTNDWIGIYKMGVNAGDAQSTAWQYVRNSNGSLTFSNLPKGYYYASYFLQNSYNNIGNKTFFKVVSLKFIYLMLIFNMF